MPCGNRVRIIYRASGWRTHYSYASGPWAIFTYWMGGPHFLNSYLTRAEAVRRAKLSGYRIADE